MSSWANTTKLRNIAPKYTLQPGLNIINAINRLGYREMFLQDRAKHANNGQGSDCVFSEESL